MITFEQRATCPVCDRPGAEPFHSARFDAEPLRSYLLEFYRGACDPDELASTPFELCRCPECGLTYQRWVPDDASLADLYSTMALAAPGEVTATRGLATRLSYSHDIERVIRYFGSEPGAIQLLDFGSGTGMWLQMAAALGCSTAAAELASDAVERLRLAGHKVFDADDLPPESFDFINTEQVFEHLTRPREVALRLVAALKPGGLLRISVPNERVNGTSIEERLAVGDWAAPKSSANSLNAVAPLEHVNCFNHGALVRLGREAGLTPFLFPLRAEIHAAARLRFAASALVHKVRPPSGTLLYFRRSDASG